MDDILKRMLDRERPVIVGLTSTAARLIGLALRDRRGGLIDEAAEALDGVVDGLERFGAIAGCDTGADYTVVALRQIVGWLRARDLGAARREFDARARSEDRFYESMDRAFEETAEFRRGADRG